ncbi:ECF transporter S component [Clostridium cochlearium]|jgi:riboflavin transporter FmnP|uniref:Riboflavin transporter n=1 Tax=Clostridium cochlearium TaxID=1494 RepID=A0A239Z2E5_CLOCO|nr:ECF transporter S component [Clostridium cochlearium]NSJ91962.1 ECF transporter S component [Coprococcus sp. MSK.21.13]MBE6065486.1 ECF transporter S component [Clostridium cochlearium]MBU5270119.1 ECF transporter S component [Clostridium cochlearium]MCR1972217.1 ECF transporter S component [Clostridium cochlearium]MDU1443202.1 ECF transporter S component [Clostridium cochlearium]
MKNKKLSRSIKITLLSTIAFLLMYIELAVPFFPEFLKIDISDIPALMGAFALGPVEGVIIQLLKNILHGIFATKTGFVGEVANFVVGSVLVFVAGYIYRNNKSKRSAFVGLVAGTITMSVIAGILNLYVFIPLYQKILHIPIEAFVQMTAKVNPSVNSLGTLVLWSIVPFNLLKGVFISALTMGMYKKVSPILHEEGIKKGQIA